MGCIAEIVSGMPPMRSHQKRTRDNSLSFRRFEWHSHPAFSRDDRCDRCFDIHFDDGQKLILLFANFQASAKLAM